MPFVYPEVYEGCEVLWAPQSDAPPLQWTLGKVYRLKNQSCDIKVETASGIMFRENVMHADDPRLNEMKQNHARGVFKLNQREIDIRKAIATIPGMDARLRAMNERLDGFQRSFETLSMQNKRWIEQGIEPINTRSSSTLNRVAKG